MLAMFSDSWKVPWFVEPSPKKQTQTWSVPRMRMERPAPQAMQWPAPTMPFAPRMPLSRSAMCMEPPLPLQ